MADMVAIAMDTKRGRFLDRLKTIAADVEEAGPKDENFCYQSFLREVCKLHDGSLQPAVTVEEDPMFLCAFKAKVDIPQLQMSAEGKGYNKSEAKYYASKRLAISHQEAIMQLVNNAFEKYYTMRHEYLVHVKAKQQRKRQASKNIPKQQKGGDQGAGSKRKKRKRKNKKNKKDRQVKARTETENQVETHSGASGEVLFKIEIKSEIGTDGTTNTNTCVVPQIETQIYIKPDPEIICQAEAGAKTASDINTETKTMRVDQ